MPTQSASWPLLGKSPQQLDCRENWIYAYRIHQLPQNDCTFSNMSIMTSKQLGINSGGVLVLQTPII